jgi:hypothetical protein
MGVGVMLGVCVTVETEVDDAVAVRVCIGDAVDVWMGVGVTVWHVPMYRSTRLLTVSI